MNLSFKVIVIGGGHAGVEAAWSAANLLATDRATDDAPGVALVTLDPSKIGVMSCNPAIGGLAKGQIVREIDALGGLMGLAADSTGIQFKVLNTSKGAAVHGPRAQCDKHAYADAVQAMIRSRPDIRVIGGSVERLVVEGGGGGRVRGVEIVVSPDQWHDDYRGRSGASVRLEAANVVLTTGTFMRGLMHTGEEKSAGGRYGEAAAVGISGALKSLGFELGRLKTGTPPRLSKRTIRWEELKDAPGDEKPAAFSELSGVMGSARGEHLRLAPEAQQDAFASLRRFPVQEQVPCKAHADEPPSARLDPREPASSADVHGAD